MTSMELFTQSTGLLGQVVSKLSTTEGKKQFRENFGSFAQDVVTFRGNKEHMNNSGVSLVANLMVIAVAQIIAYRINNNTVNPLHAIIACCCAPCYLLWAVLSRDITLSPRPVQAVTAASTANVA